MFTGADAMPCDFQFTPNGVAGSRSTPSGKLESSVGINTCSPTFTNDAFKIAATMYCSDMAGAITKYGPIKYWNVSNVDTMNQAFYQSSGPACTAITDVDLSKWDVSKVRVHVSIARRPAAWWCGR